jgi:phytoene dehydrogenase-like protein
MNTAFDVIVIGAGAGGLLTAARLAHRGYRTLVVERLGYVGGRASTRDIDGFKVNNGASREHQGALEVMLGHAAEPLALGVPAEPHARPDVLCLDVEVLRALDVDQHRRAAAVEQNVVRAEFAVDER